MASKLKRNYIQLVEGENDKGELTFETYLTPHFISADLWYECIDVMDEMETMEEEMARIHKDSEKSGETENKKSSAGMLKEQMDLLMGTVVKIYGSQFTKKELRSGLHAPDMVESLQKQVEFIAMGQQDAATKKFVESLS